MSTIQDLPNKEIKKTSLGSYKEIAVKKLPAKNIISDIRIPVVKDPIDPKRISRKPTNSLTKSSLVKAGLVFLGTFGLYYLRNL